MNKIESLLNKYKKEFCEATGSREIQLVSDSELLVEWQDKLASNFEDGHAEYWDEIIRWADERFALIAELPNSCVVEKAALVQGLGGYDSTKLSEKDYQTLLVRLHQTLNKPSKDAYTLANNRSNGAKANSKRSLEVNVKIRIRANELAQITRLKKSIVRTLMDEFKLSEATIRRAISNK